MTSEKIKRINELAAIAKSRALTAEEQNERAQLRKEYIEAVRRNLRSQLDQITILEPDGTKIDLKNHHNGQ